MAKKQSKRISTRKREKINKKIREHHRKVRKESKEKKKIPKSVLLTQEEKDQLQQIKINTEERTKNFVPEQPKLKYMEEFEKNLDSDIFVEIVDFRDIEGSRSFEVEEFLKNSSKEIEIYLNHKEKFINSKELSPNFESLNSFKNFEENSDLNNKKICIFGNRKSGKFLLTKMIEEKFSNTECVSVTTPTPTKCVSDVLRGVHDLDKIDGIFAFKEIYSSLNPILLKDFYRLPDFENEEQFLTLMGNKYSEEKKPRKCMEAGAKKVIYDILKSKILWIKENGIYKFQYQ